MGCNDIPSRGIVSFQKLAAILTMSIPLEGVGALCVPKALPMSLYQYGVGMVVPIQNSAVSSRMLLCRTLTHSSLMRSIGIHSQARGCRNEACFANNVCGDMLPRSGRIVNHSCICHEPCARAKRNHTVDLGEMSSAASVKLEGIRRRQATVRYGRVRGNPH